MPLLGAFILLTIPSRKTLLLRLVALGFSFTTFLISLFLWILFNKQTSAFEYRHQLLDLGYRHFSCHLNITLGVDDFAVSFIILTALLVLLCILASWDSVLYRKKSLIAFLVLESLWIFFYSFLDIDLVDLSNNIHYGLLILY